MYLTFDAENRGLFGEAFAVGYVLTTDGGSVVWSGIHCCDMEDAAPDPMETTPDLTENWLRNHVLPALPEPDCLTTRAVRDRFADAVQMAMSAARKQNEKLTFVADVPFPCETGFLRACRLDSITRSFAFPSPYPLIDVASVLLARGYDPVGTYQRRENELPAHNPLCDARQSSRIFHQLLRGEPIP